MTLSLSAVQSLQYVIVADKQTVVIPRRSCFYREWRTFAPVKNDSEESHATFECTAFKMSL